MRTALIRRRRMGGNPLASYAANGFTPAMGFNLPADVFAVDGSTVSGLSDVLTVAATANGTVIDSDGLLKWRAHNLIQQSSAMTIAPWLNLAQGDGSSPVKTNNYALAPDGTMTATRIQFARGSAGVPNRSAIYQTFTDALTTHSNTVGVWLKSNTSSTYTLALLNTAATDGTVTIEVTPEWQYFSHQSSVIISSSQSIRFGIIDNYGTTLEADVLAWGARVYRSSLGGMQENPDAWSATDPYYAPTTAAAAYKRRYDYTPGAKRLLGEPARTNSLPYSNTLTSWAISNTDSVTLTAANATGPDGNLSLTKLAITDTTNEIHGIQQPTLTIVSGQDFVASAVVDFTTGQQQHVGIRVFASTDQWVSAIFDISAGTVTQSSGGASSGTIKDTGVIDLGGGLYRIWVSGSIANTFATMAVFTSDSGTPTLNSFGGAAYAGTAGVYFHAGFMDFNANGSVPCSHIPTSGAAVATAADTITVPAANLPTGGAGISFAMKGEIGYADNNAATQFDLLRWRTDINNYVKWGVDTSTTRTGSFYAQQIKGGVLVTSVDHTTPYTPGYLVPFAIASRHTSGAVQVATDLVTAAEGATADTLFDGSAVNLILVNSGDGPVWVEEFWAWGDNIAEAGVTEAATL